MYSARYSCQILIKAEFP